MSHYLSTNKRGSQVLGGRFACKGTSNPSDKTGDWFTVARTGTGEYTVTFVKKWKRIQLMSTLSSSDAATTTGFAMNIGVPVDSGGFWTQKVSTMVESGSTGISSAADITAKAGSEVLLVAFCEGT